MFNKLTNNNQHKPKIKIKLFQILNEKIIKRMGETEP
jgi:hypothetical protein